VTDNRADGTVLHPPEVVRLDGDDPYLVVAADKGTAHLSDTANRVSAQYGFWLGDAFASGGSAGYDHKKMGITARGAWECVKHHFRNLGTDIQTRAVHRGRASATCRATCSATGSSSPGRSGWWPPSTTGTSSSTPIPTRRGASGARADVLARPLDWRDYDPALLSRGGGVYDRSAKAIPLSPEARALLDIEGGDPSGEEVMRKILTARVDLLYNGGIGTYAKAESEEHAEVGDRSNDRVRVNGREVRARVIGEGGQPRPHPEEAGSSTGRRAAGSTPTRWTTRAGWTPRTTR
jgi:glutamate dehydrogenase